MTGEDFRDAQALLQCDTGGDYAKRLKAALSRALDALEASELDRRIVNDGLAKTCGERDAAMARAEKAERERDEARGHAERLRQSNYELENRVIELSKTDAAVAFGPRWTCAGCGSCEGFNSVKYDTPGEPIEYDMECKACGSTDVCESAVEAAAALGERAEAAEARVKELVQARPLSVEMWQAMEKDLEGLSQLRAELLLERERVKKLEGLAQELSLACEGHLTVRDFGLLGRVRAALSHPKEVKP